MEEFIITLIEDARIMAGKKTGLQLNQVLFQVRDVERSREFYTEKLGFKLFADFSPEYVAVITPNRLQIGFYPSKGRVHRLTDKEKPAAIEFEVDNADTWYQRLRKRGVRFSGRPKTEWGEREARFKDPDGFTLAISSPVRSKK